MTVSAPPLERSGTQTISASVDIDSEPEAIFSLLCSVEKWPVWLPFLRSARRTEFNGPLALGSDVMLRSLDADQTEELYEVDQYLANHHLSFVGAYSVRRRIEFRIDRKTSRSRLSVRLSYPLYHGRIAAALGGWRRNRKVLAQLESAMTNFKGLVEYRRDDEALGDL